MVKRFNGCQCDRGLLLAELGANSGLPCRMQCSRPFYHGSPVAQSVQGEARATKRRIVSRSSTDWEAGSAVEGHGLPGSFFHICGLGSVAMGRPCIGPFLGCWERKRSAWGRDPGMMGRSLESKFSYLFLSRNVLRYPSSSASTLRWQPRTIDMLFLHIPTIGFASCPVGGAP